MHRNLKNKTAAYVMFAALLFSFGCHQKNKISHKDNVKTVDNTVVKTAPKPHFTYRLDSIANRHDLDSFHAMYDTAQTKIIEALNRLSPGRIRVGCKLIIPDPLSADIMAYSPYPTSISSLDSIPKIILINQRIQAFALYENGKLIRWGPTSTGRKNKPTPAGLLYTNYKARLKISTIDGDWKMPWYFNIQNRSGIGMHQFVMPGYPASHSCIRLLEGDAIFIFHWADQWKLSENGTQILRHGTPVIIFGSYAFGDTPPWRKLAEDSEAATISDDDIKTINGFVSKIVK
jgi:hypothetical protein